MIPPPSHAFFTAIDRTAGRLRRDYADAYHDLPERSSLPPPLEMEFAIGALRRALGQDLGPMRLPLNARRALDQAAPTIMGLISSWPAPMREAAAAWELALMSLPDAA